MSIFKEHNISLGRKGLREVLRVIRDLIGLYHHSKYRLIQRHYDKNWPSQIQVTEGAISLTNKIAILVLFQPDELRKSTIETCTHLTSRGYAVLAVSNTQMTDDSRQRLSKVVYQICERPNYGYDAGAYRDGVWMLRQNNLKPDHLILLNDSVWFPLTPDNDSIERLEKQVGMFGGLVRKTNNKLDMKRQKETSGFIEAYFYHVNLTKDPSRELWARFWDQLKLTTGRKHLKEDRVSIFLSRAGVENTALGSRYSFLREMERLPTSEIRKVLHYAAYSNPTRSEEGAALCKEGDCGVWREKALLHIRETVARYPFYASFIYGSEKIFGLGFLKRKNSPLHHKAHKKYLKAVRAGDLPAPTDIVLSELEEICGEHRETEEPTFHHGQGTMKDIHETI